MIDLATIEKAMIFLPDVARGMATARELVAESERCRLDSTRLRATLGECERRYLELAWWVDRQLEPPGIMES